MQGAAQAFRDDLASVDDDGWSAEQNRELEEQNERIHVRRMAYEANLRLTQHRDPAYARRSCTAGKVQDLLVGVFTTIRRRWPTFECSGAYGRISGRALTDRAPIATANGRLARVGWRTSFTPRSAPPTATSSLAMALR
jgi:hypothetical protein